MERKRVNLIGKRYGKGVVTELIKNNRPKGLLWKLICDCGKEYQSYTRHLNFRSVKSCGCLKSSNLIGQQFGYGTVIDKTNKRIDRKIVWKLICKCGKEYEASTVAIKSNNTKSCGCMLHQACCGDISGTFYSQIRKGARERKLEFNVTIQDLWNLYLKQDKICALSGVPLFIQKSAKLHNKGQSSGSLDRIDSSKGYIIGNIQWVHKKINVMKHIMTNEELLDWCKKIVDFNK